MNKLFGQPDSFSRFPAPLFYQHQGMRKGEGLLQRTVVKNKDFGIREDLFSPLHPTPPPFCLAVGPRTISLIFPSFVSIGDDNTYLMGRED